MKLFRTLFFARRKLMAVLPLMKDERVPLTLKGLALVLAILVFSPLNFLGYIPIIGLFDDAALLMFISTWFVNEATKHTVRNISRATSTDLIPQ
ncbi:MAG: hypothetical protein ABR584_03275 [Candidatus Baltobacteraceae bacterium]